MDSLVGRAQNEIIAHYEQRFRDLFGDTPVIDDDDVHIAGSLARKYSPAKAKAFIDLYLTLDNKWVRDQGYPLRLVLRQLNAVMVANPTTTQKTKQLWVLGFTECGHPVRLPDKDWARDKPKWNVYTPVLWEEWLTLSINEKLQYPLRWGVSWQKLYEWIQLWQEQGWLVEGEGITNPYDPDPTSEETLSLLAPVSLSAKRALFAVMKKGLH